VSVRVRGLKPHPRIPPRPPQIRADLLDQLGRDGFAARGFLEEEERGHGFAVDVLGGEDGVHLLGERFQLRRPARL
jgi:hypothetical protein